jgi:hypothetical protein
MNYMFNLAYEKSTLSTKRKRSLPDLGASLPGKKENVPRALPYDLVHVRPSWAFFFVLGGVWEPRQGFEREEKVWLGFLRD